MVVRRTEPSIGQSQEFPERRPISKSLALARDHTHKAVSNVRFGKFEPSKHQITSGGVGKNLTKLAWENMIHFLLY